MFRTSWLGSLAKSIDFIYYKLKGYKMDKEYIKQVIKTWAYKYKEEGFKLSSGKESKHYFDLRKVLFVPDHLTKVCELIIWKIEALDKLLETKINCVSGLTLGADPLTYGLSLVSKLNNKQPLLPLVVRKEAKSHGTQSLIEGIAPSAPQCLVVDDVITTGASTLKAVKALREAGIKIVAAYCVLDREEGGQEALAAEGVQLYSLFKKSDFGIGE